MSILRIPGCGCPSPAASPPRLLRHEAGFGLQAHMHDGAHIVAGSLLHHLAEHVEAFSLPFGEGVFLSHGSQVDAFF